jgi:hypothetical protein
MQSLIYSELTLMMGFHIDLFTDPALERRQAGL